MSLKLADGRTLYTSCNAGGAFELKPIAPGEARLQVRIENPALGTFRPPCYALEPLDAVRSLKRRQADPNKTVHIPGRRCVYQVCRCAPGL